MHVLFIVWAPALTKLFLPSARVRWHYLSIQQRRQKSGVELSSRGDKNNAEDQEAALNNAEDQKAAGVFSQWPIVAGIYVFQRDVNTSAQAHFANTHCAIRSNLSVTCLA